MPKPQNKNGQETEKQHGVPTAPRYSFEDDTIGRSDRIYGGVGILSRRILEYAKPTPEAEVVRHKLAQRGLVLGLEEALTVDSTKRFVVPGARPIGYDAASNTGSPNLYSDADRFFELGIMLRDVAQIDDETLEITGDIGGQVAEIEFTRPGERRLFFVPGFEHYLKPSPDGQEEVFRRYVKHLADELGERFERHIEGFAQGFDS